MTKRSLLVIAVLTLAALSCKKYVQQQEQNSLVSLVTNGTWIVTRYLDSGTNFTSTFSGYVFRFSTNGTVTGTLGSNVNNGIWAGDLNNRTITSNFPAAGNPLAKLNYTWKITDSYTDSVAANTMVNGATNYLSLKKQ